MDTKNINESTISRIENLENFKHKMDTKILVAMTVATVLGITSIVSGGWISSLVKDLNELTDKTGKLDKKLQQWDREVASAISQLDKKEANIDISVQMKAKEVLNKLLIDIEKEYDMRQQDFDSSLKAKKEEISKLGVNEIAKIFSNGSTDMTVKSLSIKNSNGNTAAILGSDNGGDGFFRLNSDRGDMRYNLKLSNNRPQGYYYNDVGVNVITLGVFSDDQIGFARLYGQENGKIQLELKSNSKGGVLSTYSSDGKQIVYLGPDSNSGNGLVNVMGLKGEITNSHAPK